MDKAVGSRGRKEVGRKRLELAYEVQRECLKIEVRDGAAEGEKCGMMNII